MVIPDIIISFISNLLNNGSLESRGGLLIILSSFFSYAKATS